MKRGVHPRHPRQDTTPNRPPPSPIDQHNAFGEWRNVHDDAPGIPELRRAMQRLPQDVDASIAYIRSKRPSIPAKALQFWNTPLARAHAMIALLGRGNRTISQLHHDLGIGHDRLYTYLPRWNVDWQRRPDEATAQDPAGDRVTVCVEAWHADVTATVRLQGYALRTRARWLPDAWEFRLDAPLNAEQYVTPQLAARLLNCLPETVLEIVPTVAFTARRRPLLSLNDVSLLLPPTEWRTTLQGAARDLNPCRCAYWHAHTGTCGLQPDRALPEPGTAPYACEDHLEIS